MMEGPGADSEEKHEPVSDIDTVVVVVGLKALDPEWPIREAIGGKADIARTVVKRGGCTSSRIAYRRRPVQQLRQLGEVRRHPPRIVPGEQLGGPP